MTAVDKSLLPYVEPGAENSTSDVSLYCTFKPKGDTINVAKTACGFSGSADGHAGVAIAGCCP